MAIPGISATCQDLRGNATKVGSASPSGEVHSVELTCNFGQARIGANPFPKMPGAPLNQITELMHRVITGRFFLMAGSTLGKQNNKPHQMFSAPFLKMWLMCEHVAGAAKALAFESAR